VPSVLDRDARAVTPAVGVVLLVAITVVLASTVAVAFAVDASPATPAPAVHVDLAVNASTDTFTLTHTGGDALDVDALRVVVTVADTPIRHQPPVPFFAATGFVSGPTGPFNRGFDGEWTAGQTTTFTLAGTNTPRPDPGDTVTVTLYANDLPVDSATTTASAPTTANAPTTNAPTTNAPTTNAPTTNAPTTNAPTTNAPTTNASTRTAHETDTLIRQFTARSEITNAHTLAPQPTDSQIRSPVDSQIRSPVDSYIRPSIQVARAYTRPLTRAR
jgi:FlaG/FlaF family flagellin (archaellin)